MTAKVHRSTMGEDLARTTTITTSGGSRNCRRPYLDTRRVPRGVREPGSPPTASTNLRKQPPEGWLTESRRNPTEGPGARAPNETRHKQGKTPGPPTPKPGTGSGGNARRAVSDRSELAGRTFHDARRLHAYRTLCRLSQNRPTTRKTFTPPV